MCYRVCSWGVFMGCVHGVCSWGVFMGCVHGVCSWGVFMGCVHGVCLWGVFMGACRNFVSGAGQEKAPYEEEKGLHMEKKAPYKEYLPPPIWRIFYPGGGR